MVQLRRFAMHDKIYNPVPKELPQVNMTYHPVEDRKSQLLSFLEFVFEFCSILVKFYKSLYFTEFHSLLLDNFEWKSYVLLSYLI